MRLVVAILLPVLFLFPVLEVYAAQQIDLESAIDFALRQNRTLRLSELSLESRGLSLRNARTAFTTRLSPLGEGSSSENGDQYAYGIRATRKTTLGTSVQLDATVARQRYEGADVYHRSGVKLEMTQPLLRQFGTLVNREPIAAAESSLTAARRDLELKKTDLVIQVVESFEQLLLLQQQLVFNEQTLRRLDMLQRLTRVREKQGRATRVDVLRVELQYGEAESRLSETRERLGSARADFADLLGFPVDQEFEALPTDIPSVDVGDPAAASSVALANRLDCAQVQQDCADAERGRRIARRNLLPDLNLITRYEKYGEGNEFSRGTSLDQESWFVGLSAGADLFRRSERIAFRQAELNEVTAAQMLVILEAATERQVRQAILSYVRTHAEIRFAERNHNLAQGRARLARKRFEMGRGDVFSVSDAEDALLQAQNKMLSAQTEAVIASYRLLRSMGILIDYPEDLKPLSGNRGADTAGRGGER